MASQQSLFEYQYEHCSLASDISSLPVADRPPNTMHEYLPGPSFKATARHMKPNIMKMEIYKSNQKYSNNCENYNYPS